jgi:hypothetical protein
MLGLAACGGPRLGPGTAEWGSWTPPRGLAVVDTPQFVYFTSDDNGFSGLPGSGGEGGVHFLTELFAGRRNPGGTVRASAVDGAPLHLTLFVNTMFIESGAAGGPMNEKAGRDDPVFVKRAWKQALVAGHELALHTHSHPHGGEFSVEQWREEIRRNVDYLTRPWDPEEQPGRPNPDSGLGLDRDEILGFRAPFIEYNDNALTAVEREGLVYDSSVEEAAGTLPGRVGFVWPYRLDRGRPGNEPPLGPHPGLWEIPIYDFIVPPDEACPRYGIPAGLRDRLRDVQDYFVPANGEITGMDWNLWQEFELTPAEFTATLEYTLDRHLAGGRCPMIVGLHADLYSSKAGRRGGGGRAALRRAALREFLDYAQARPQVRIVSCRELLSWLRDSGAQLAK